MLSCAVNQEGTGRGTTQGTARAAGRLAAGGDTATAERPTYGAADTCNKGAVGRFGENEVSFGGCQEGDSSKEGPRGRKGRGKVGALGAEGEAQAASRRRQERPLKGQLPMRSAQA